jgi:hypothetical protein
MQQNGRQYMVPNLLIFFSLLFVCNVNYLQAQVSPPDTSRNAIPDSLRPVISDTLRPALQDTIPPVIIDEEDEDDLEGIILQAQNPQSERRAVADAVNFQARDSLIFNYRDGRKAFLYGSSTVRHTSGELRSGSISLDLNNSLVEARTQTPEDTLSYPILSRDGDDLKSNRILFNYKTEKGKFEVAEIQIDDGYLIGTKVKNVSKTEVFIEDGIYSTCPPDHMYYYIKARRMKVVDEDEIFFTNARLFILDIPYPILFPFGYVPAGIDKRRSGLLEPTYVYQNTSTRGLGLQNFGWFQYFNDYLVGQTALDIFTSGTVHNETRFQYRVTNKFDGAVTFGYSNERGLESTDLDFTENVNKRLSIRHNQQFSPYASLSSDINLSTQNYFRRNSYDINERAQSSTRSSLSYNYRDPDGVFTLGLSTRLNQQFNTNTTRLTGPEASFSLRQFSPFESSTPGSQDRKWYERVTIRYNNNFSSDYNFRPLAADSAEVNWFEALLDPQKFREATGNDRHIKYGFRQRAEINAAQIIPSQYVNISANFSVTEFWYPTTTRREFVPEDNRAVTRLERGFAAAREFNTGINLTSTIYGISQAKIGNFNGFRHTLRPSIGFSYRPDFSDERWGFYRDVQIDTTGRTQRYSIFQDEIYGGPGAGEQQSLNFGITNVFETKFVKRDSTGEVQSRNLRLIDNLSLNSSYNFAADSLHFSPLRVALTTRVIEGLSLNFNATFSPYTPIGQNQFSDTYIWNSSNKILQPLSYSVSANTSFRGGQTGGIQVSTPPYRPYDPFDQSLFRPVDPRFNYAPVADFSSPWSVGLNFSYQWNYRFNEPATRRAILNASGIQFNITPKWNFTTQVGYDFIEKELTPSQFSLTRQMVCWNLSFQFNPFGDFQYYFFRLTLDSGQLQSLFQKLPGLNNLERSSSPTGSGNYGRF